MSVDVGKLIQGLLGLGSLPAAVYNKITTGEFAPGIDVGAGINQLLTGRDRDVIEGMSGAGGERNPLEGQSFGETVYSAGPTDDTKHITLDSIVPLSNDLNVGGNSSGGTSGKTYAQNSGARSVELANLAGIDPDRGNKIKTINDSYNRLMSQYTDEDTQAKQSYTDQTSTNENNLSRGNQAALLAGAQGSSALKAILASYGALGRNATGNLLANRAVANSVNTDIGGARDTFDTNASTLATNWANTEQQQRNRRNEANATLEGNIASANKEAETNRQSIYGKLASLFMDTGDTSSANDYYSRAAGQTEKINKFGYVKPAEFTPKSAVYNPADVKSYLGNISTPSVRTDANSIINSPLYSLQRKKEQLA